MTSCPRATLKGALRPVFEIAGGAVCEDADLGRLRLHDLRHTMASHAVMSGENLPLVGKLLGHRRHRTAAGYAYLADDHLFEAAKRVGRIIEGSMRGRP